MTRQSGQQTPSVGNSGDTNKPVGREQPRRRPTRAPRGRRHAEHARRRRRSWRHERRDGDAQRRARPGSRASMPNCGPADEVLLQQVVGDGRLHLDAGKQRVERRRDDLARSERGRPDEHDLVAQRLRRDLAAQDVRRRDVGERALLARDSAAAGCSCRRAARSGRRCVSDDGVHVRDAERHVACAGRRRDRRQRERRDRRGRRARRAAARA